MDASTEISQPYPSLPSSFGSQSSVFSREDQEVLKKIKTICEETNVFKKEAAEDKQREWQKVFQTVFHWKQAGKSLENLEEMKTRVAYVIYAALLLKPKKQEKLFADATTFTKFASFAKQVKEINEISEKKRKRGRGVSESEKNEVEKVKQETPTKKTKVEKEERAKEEEETNYLDKLLNWIESKKLLLSIRAGTVQGKFNRIKNADSPPSESNFVDRAFWLIKDFSNDEQKLLLNYLQGKDSLSGKILQEAAQNIQYKTLTHDNLEFHLETDNLGLSKELKVFLLAQQRDLMPVLLKLMNQFQTDRISQEKWRQILEGVLEQGANLDFNAELIGWIVKTFEEQNQLKNAFDYFKPLYPQYRDLDPLEKKICRDAIAWKKFDLGFEEIRAFIEEALSYNRGRIMGLIAPSVLHKHLETTDDLPSATKKVISRLNQKGSEALTSGVTLLLATREEFADGLAEALRAHIILLKRIETGERLPGSSELISDPHVPYTDYYFEKAKMNTVIHMAQSFGEPRQASWAGIQFSVIYKNDGQFSISHGLPLISF